MILLFDTSTPTGFLLLGKDGRVSASATWQAEHSHSQKLPPQILAALEAAGANFKDLTHIAVGIGPGSFTGLRVALATAKGLGVSLGIPIAGIPSLELFAAGCAAETNYIVPTTDAFRGEIYVGVYERGTVRPVSEIQSLTPEHAIEAIRRLQKPVTLTGTGYTRYKSLFDAALSQQVTPLSVATDLAAMLKLAEGRISKSRFSDAAEIQPYYVREAEAVEKRRPVK